MANPYNFILRTTKGSALTHQELDDTFRYLNYAIQNVSGGTGSTTTIISGGTDTYVTGGTYSNGSLTFINNTGGTFTVTGLFTGNTEVYVTGGTYSSGTLTFRNNTGGTFTITGITSTSVTGGTNEVLYIKPSGTLSSDSLFTRNVTTGEFSVAGALGASPFDISSVNIGTLNLGINIDGSYLFHEINGGVGGYAAIFAGDGTAAGLGERLTIIKANDSQNSSQVVVIPQAVVAETSDGTNDAAMTLSPTQFIIDGTYNSIPASTLFYIDLTGGTVSIGDGTGIGNGTKLVIRDDVPELKFHIASGETFNINNNGNIRTFFLHDNPTTQGDSSQQDIRSGTYLPSISNQVNISGSSISEARWIRVGNVVTVSGAIKLGVTSDLDVVTSFELSLPVSSNNAFEFMLAGVASSQYNLSAAIYSNNQRAKFEFIATSPYLPIITTPDFGLVLRYTFTYEVM